MFRKLTSSLSAAVSGLDPKVQQLEAMGFTREQAKTALACTDGNVEQAASLLLASNSDPPSQRPKQRNTAAASAASQRRATATTKPKATPKATKTTTTKRAATTSTTNNNNIPARGKPQDALATHHPDVKVPEKLENKSKEEQILRCTDRLKGYPLAVDTLYKALSALKKEPYNAKFRKVDQTSAGYKKALEAVPGAESLLLAVNFTKKNRALVLEYYNIDKALLYLGVSALEGARQSSEYKQAKLMIEFTKQLKAIQLQSNESEQEAVKRAAFMAKCPSEPEEGRGALMQVKMGDETFKRRFDSDDVLEDVIHWIGGHGSVIPERLLQREWCLIDLNRTPRTPIDCKGHSKKTLQYVGCWPSGMLELCPSPEQWRVDGTKMDVQVGSSRGLGSAHSSTM